jgi:monoamine oxidase
MNRIESVDVVIVGAGFTGLSAAKYFSSKSIEYILIEGRGRVGGRTLSEKVLDEQWTIDLGGQWIGPNQKRVLALIEEYDLHLIEQTWYHYDPTHLGQQIGLKALSDEQLHNINEVCSQWDRMALELPNVDNALEYEKSAQWSQISVAQFLHEHPLVKDDRIKQELKLHTLTLTGKKV